MVPAVYKSGNFLICIHIAHWKLKEDKSVMIGRYGGFRGHLALLMAFAFFMASANPTPTPNQRMICQRMMVTPAMMEHVHRLL